MNLLLNLKEPQHSSFRVFQIYTRALNLLENLLIDQVQCSHRNIQKLRSILYQDHAQIHIKM